MLPTPKVLSPFVLATLVAFPTLAGGQSDIAPACADLPAPLYGRGSSSLNVVVSKLAPLLARGSTPRTLVYKDDGPCEGLASLSDSAQPLTGYAKYWENGPDGRLEQRQCSLPSEVEAAPGAAFAITSSDLDTLACPGITSLPAGMVDLIGPVRSLSFVVPRESKQEVVSAEAAYHLYAFGGSAGVTPWTEDRFIYALGPGPTSLVARALAIPAAHFRKTELYYAGVVAALSSASAEGKAEQAIGFEDTFSVEANRPAITPLAYQHFDQNQGYWPDSTSRSFDKLNVREGRYWLWHTHHLLARGTEGGLADEGVARLANLLGTNPDQVSEIAGLNAVIEAGQVPRCAMRVWRDEDFGPLYGIAPTAPCRCYFEAAKAESESTCATCEASRDCPNATDVCSYGYCEPN